MIEEIKAAARRRLAADGANLSLRGVASDLDIVPSALYRYFSSRDQLLTALITESYQALGEAARRAAAQAPSARPRKRFLAVSHAVRQWALDHPAEYSLLYGGPVPGYAAPQDTVAPASAVILLLVEIAAEGAAQGQTLPPSAPVPELVRRDLQQLIDQHSADISEELLSRAFAGWTHLFGLISFEVFGRLETTIQARREYFDHQMGLMADLCGLHHGL
ncbi:TetR/AcrR family transcriptional regulator [Nonomuraea sediminis]|uniref:TetR/AcrR family transcriptional regulator n=1 Tax=Nonomuraea sediminis TaxID=2835864 RepID=UPI001BDCCD6C|nr:TetR/AcrR family transcriptional regulator [Nonomuraea sediminis]